MIVTRHDGSPANRSELDVIGRKHTLAVEARIVRKRESPEGLEIRTGTGLACTPRLGALHLGSQWYVDLGRPALGLTSTIR